MSGIVCALVLRIPVILADNNESKIHHTFAMESARLNGIEEMCKPFDLKWGNPESAEALITLLPKGPILIVGSDLFYKPEQFDYLFMTVSLLLKSREKSTFLTVFQERSSRRNVNHLIEKWGLEARCLSPEELHGADKCASTFLALIRGRSDP